MNFSLNLLGTEIPKLHYVGSVESACAIAFAMTIVIIVAFFLSKKFINIEFDKLKDLIDCKFDQFYYFGIWNCIIGAGGGHWRSSFWIGVAFLHSRRR